MSTSEVKAPTIPIPPRKTQAVPAESKPPVSATTPQRVETGYQAAKTTGTNLTGVSKVGKSELIPARQVTICLTGAVDQTSFSNRDFEKMCDLLADRDTGLIKDGKYNSFDTFPKTWAPDSIVQKVLNAMDANKDRLVNKEDGKIELNVLGFSWGGVRATELTKKVLDRVEPGEYLKVNLGLIDAFQPFTSRLKVDARVSKTVNFLHSVGPDMDCSRSGPVGPFLGKQIECGPDQDCTQFDLSGPPEPGSLWEPSNPVDHCDMPHESSLYITNLVLFGYLMGQGNENRLPPAIPVKRYIVP